MNWDDPAERARLIEQVGPEEYERRLKLHFADSTVAVVNGYSIRTVGSRYGRLFMVDGTNKAFATLDAATAFAKQQTPLMISN